MDRLGWAAGISFRAYGLLAGIRTNDPRAASLLEGLLPDGARQVPAEAVDHLFSLWLAKKGGTRVRPFHLAYHGASILARSLHREEVVTALRVALLDWAAEHSRRETFLHAGVVEWEGRAILIPGPSRTGKTRLVAAFLAAGARYYSDEFAALDARARVRPVLKPLDFREPDGTTHGRSAQALGGSVGTRRVEIGCVLATSYHAEAHWNPRRMASGQTLLVLLKNAVAVRRRPRSTVSRLRAVAIQAVGLRGHRAEAEEVVRAVLEAPPWRAADSGRDGLAARAGSSRCSSCT